LAVAYGQLGFYSVEGKIHQFPGQRFECNIMGHLPAKRLKKREQKCEKLEERIWQGQEDKP